MGMHQSVAQRTGMHRSVAQREGMRQSGAKRRGVQEWGVQVARAAAFGGTACQYESGTSQNDLLIVYSWAVRRGGQEHILQD
jgi:hypothetical protein